VSLPAGSVLALSPAHRALRYEAAADCLDDKGARIMWRNGEGDLVLVSALAATSSLACSLEVATRASAHARDQDALDHLAVRVNGGDTALYPMTQQGLSFQRMRAVLTRSSTPDPAVGSPADLVLTLTAPLQQGDLLFLQFAPTASLRLHTAAGYTTAACVEDASLAVLEPRSPSSLRIRLLRDAPNFACTFTVTPATPMSRSAPAPVLSVPRYGAALELPSPLVMVDPSRSLDLYLRSMPLQGTTGATAVVVSLSPAATDAGELVFTVPYETRVSGRRPTFAAECLAGRSVVAIVESEVLRFPLESSAFDTVLRLTFPAGAYKPRSQGPTACTIAFYVNDAESFYFLRPEGPDGDVEMTVPYGSPETSPILPRAAVELASRVYGVDVLSVALPPAQRTAARWAVQVSGYDFRDAAHASTLVTYTGGAAADVVDVSVAEGGALRLELKALGPGAVYGTLRVTMDTPSAAIIIHDVAGPIPAFLQRFDNPYASARVAISYEREASLVAGFGSQLLWRIQLDNVFSERQNFVHLIFPSPIAFYKLESGCTNGDSFVSLLPSDEDGKTKLFIQGSTDPSLTCSFIAYAQAAVRAPATPLLGVLLSADDKRYHHAASPSVMPAVLTTQDFSLEPLEQVSTGLPVTWVLNYAAFSLLEGDSVELSLVSGITGAAPEFSCDSPSDGTPAMKCRNSSSSNRVIECVVLRASRTACHLALVSRNNRRVDFSVSASVAMARPPAGVQSPVQVYIPQVVFIFLRDPVISGDALQMDKLMHLSLNTTVKDSFTVDRLSIRWKSAPGQPPPRLTLFDVPCVPAPGEAPVCTAAIDDSEAAAGVTAISMVMVDPDAEVKSVEVRLPLHFSSAGGVPVSFDVHQEGFPSSRDIPIVVATAPVAQATLSALDPASSEGQLLLLEAAQPLHGAVRVSGLELPAGTAEVALRGCGEQAVTGSASVDADGVISIDADAVSFVSGSTCTVVLPAAATSASDWLTVSTADGDCDFPSSRPDHAVTVTPPSAIVTWADYPLRFQFPRLQLTSEHMFGFLADFTVANPSASSDAACSIVTAPRGAPLTVRAVVSVEPSDDLARPYRYTVSAALPDGYLTRFASVDCTLPLRVGPLSEDHDYSLVVATIGPEEHPALARVPLGKPQLEPLPSVAIGLVDTIRIDFVLTQIAFSADESLQIAPSTDRFDLFTLLRCDDAYTNDVHTLTFPLDVPLSLEPVRLHCTALMAPQANATAVTFPSHPHLPDAHMPTLQKPHPAVTAIAVSNSLRVTVSSYEAKSLVLKLQRPADKRRISRVWSPDCSFPATTYQPADWLRFYPVLSTEWVIYPRSDGQPRTCTIYADFLYTAGDGTTLDIGMLELVEDRRTLLAVAVPVLEAVLPDVAEIDLFTASDMTFSTRVAVDHTFKSTIEVTDAWAQLVGDTDAADRFYLADGTSLYASDRGRLLLSPPQYGTVVTDIAPYIGAWPLHPETSRLSLYMDGVEYPGTLAPPPLTSAIIIRQPHSARGDGAYAIETTFAAPSLLRPTLYASLELEHLPITATRCSVEGNALDLDISPYRPPRVYIPIHWSQLPTQGAVPLSLPHVTLRCVLRLADEETVFAAGALQFDISVHNDLGELGRATAAMGSLAAAATVVQLGLRLQHKSLNDRQLGILLDAVSAAAIGRLSELAADQVTVGGQETDSGDTSLVTFEFTSRGEVAVTVADVKAITGDIVAAARSLGYTVADGAEHTVSSRLVDAACSYTCGAGCRLCEDDAACAWDLDCSSGSCREGICRTPASKPTDLTILWAALLVTSIAGILVATHRILQRKIHQRSQGALLMDMDELDEV
jgi:hypothetical protein